MLVLIEYFTLGGCAGPERIFHFGRVCWSLKNISLWEGVLVLKEYFTLGACGGPERIFHFGRVCWS